MYPLNNEYLPSIDGFLEKLHREKDLKVVTNVMSTQIFGESSVVFQTLQKLISEVYSEGEQCPFVVKFLNGDVSDMKIKDY